MQQVKPYKFWIPVKIYSVLITFILTVSFSSKCPFLGRNLDQGVAGEGAEETFFFQQDGKQCKIILVLSLQNSPRGRSLGQIHPQLSTPKRPITLPRPCGVAVFRRRRSLPRLREKGTWRQSRSTSTLTNNRNLIRYYLTKL